MGNVIDIDGSSTAANPGDEDDCFGAPFKMVVAKGDAREVGDRELEPFQICQSTSLPGLSVNFFR